MNLYAIVYVSQVTGSQPRGALLYECRADTEIEAINALLGDLSERYFSLTETLLHIERISFTLERNVANDRHQQ